MKRLEVSGAVRPLYGSLGFKGLTKGRRPEVCSVAYSAISDRQRTHHWKWTHFVRIPFKYFASEAVLGAFDKKRLLKATVIFLLSVCHPLGTSGLPLDGCS